MHSLGPLHSHFHSMWHEIVCYFDQLGSIMAQKSVESIRNQLETTGHNAHVPRRLNLSVIIQWNAWQ